MKINKPLIAVSIAAMLSIPSANAAASWGNHSGPWNWSWGSSSWNSPWNNNNNYWGGPWGNGYNNHWGPWNDRPWGNRWMPWGNSPWNRPGPWGPGYYGGHPYYAPPGYRMAPPPRHHKPLKRHHMMPHKPPKAEQHQSDDHAEVPQPKTEAPVQKAESTEAKPTY